MARCDILTQLVARTTVHDPVLIVAPHPDDETIGAGGVLERMANAYVVCISDGAPENPALWPAQYPSRRAYAALRRRELERALALAGVGSDRILELGAIDQRCVFDLSKWVHALVDVMRAVRPAAVFTTPYEGGHPDHDATALISRAAVELHAQELVGPSPGPSDAAHSNHFASTRHEPWLIEMSSYHLGSRGIEVGSFLEGVSEFEPALEPFTDPVLEPRSALDPSVITSVANFVVDSGLGATRSHARARSIDYWLDVTERQRKRRMFEAHASQARVLQAFGVERERFRVAPLYDFTVPPHEGALYYQTLGWPMTGKQWCEQASRALEELGLDATGRPFFDRTFPFGATAQLRSAP